MKSKPFTTFTLVVLMICWLTGFKSSAQVASSEHYLSPVISMLETKWPKNRALNIVFHGHSVPSGYFKTPETVSLHAYTGQLWLGGAAGHISGTSRSSPLSEKVRDSIFRKLATS